MPSSNNKYSCSCQQKSVCYCRLWQQRLEQYFFLKSIWLSNKNFRQKICLLKFAYCFTCPSAASLLVASFLMFKWSNLSLLFDFHHQMDLIIITFLMYTVADSASIFIDRKIRHGINLQNVLSQTKSTYFLQKPDTYVLR